MTPFHFTSSYSGSQRFEASPSTEHQQLVVELRSAPKAVASPREQATIATRAWAEGPPQEAVGGLQVEEDDWEGMRTWRLNSADRRDAEVISWHGGGYVLDIQEGTWRFNAALARATGASVLVPLYPLAPRGNAREVVPMAARLILDRLRRAGSSPVGVLGESAGGGLALAAVQELVRSSASVPIRLTLISPWLDATLGDPRSRVIDDPMLDLDGLIGNARSWAGNLALDDPRVSPLFGDLVGLPPTFVYSSTLDLLCPDTLRLADRALKETANISFDIRAGLVHVWPAFIDLIPEAREEFPHLCRRVLGSRVAQAL